ncbi:hypothetical protein D917_02298, partial [Trichinella nativa]
MLLLEKTSFQMSKWVMNTSRQKQHRHQQQQEDAPRNNYLLALFYEVEKAFICLPRTRAFHFDDVYLHIVRLKKNSLTCAALSIYLFVVVVAWYTFSRESHFSTPLLLPTFLPCTSATILQKAVWKMRKEESENKEKESFAAPVLSCASSALIDGAEAVAFHRLLISASTYISKYTRARTRAQGMLNYG